jgi:hypothetical protein
MIDWVGCRLAKGRREPIKDGEGVGVTAGTERGSSIKT